jgi:hypothetical protein
MTDSDYQYFRCRADEERVAAERAPHPEARATHEELARRYEEAASLMQPDARIIQRYLVAG